MKSNKRGRPLKGPRVKRGRIAGLLTIRFLAQMCELPYGVVRDTIYRFLREQGKKPWEMKPREVGEFIEHAYENRTIDNSKISRIRRIVGLKPLSVREGRTKLPAFRRPVDSGGSE